MAVNRNVGGFDTSISDVGHPHVSRIGETAMTLGNRIRTLRKGRNLTQSALAAEIGWERSTIASIESGKDRPGRELLEALASHFEVSLDWITHGEGGPQPARATTQEEALMLSLFREASDGSRQAVVTLLKAAGRKREN
jgi:transcriptional regulator with XRE-family HTH domain